MSEYIPILTKFKDMTPDEVLFHIRAALQITKEDERRKVHNLSLPDIVIEFFKSKNIPQTVALENGFLLYMYLIIWKESYPLAPTTLEDFFREYTFKHRITTG